MLLGKDLFYAFVLKWGRGDMVGGLQLASPGVPVSPGVAGCGVLVQISTYSRFRKRALGI